VIVEESQLLLAPTFATVLRFSRCTRLRWHAFDRLSYCQRRAAFT
jgi:hypothetical protein